VVVGQVKGLSARFYLLVWEKQVEPEAVGCCVLVVEEIFEVETIVVVTIRYALSLSRIYGILCPSSSERWEPIGSLRYVVLRVHREK